MKCKLKKILKERGITQEQFAEMIGVTQNVISEISNNKRTSINRSFVKKSCEVLGITDLNELFEL